MDAGLLLVLALALLVLASLLVPRPLSASAGRGFSVSQACP